MSEPVAGRVPPSDLDAEAAVLCASLLDPDSLLAVSEVIQPVHFYADANRRIFESCLALQSARTPVDCVTVSGHLRDSGRLDQIGGTPYIATLVDCVPFVANVQAYARRVRDKYRLRQLISLCQKAEAEAYAGDLPDVQQFIGETEMALYAISQDAHKPTTSYTMQQVMAGCVDELQRRRSGEVAAGKLTPYRGLNRLLAGLKAGTVTTVAARPGMGKTSFVTELVVKAAADESSESRGCVFFSLEMPAEQIGNKVISQWSLIDSRSVDTGFMRAADFNAALIAANSLRVLPIVIDDKGGITLTEMRSALRRHQRTLLPQRLGLVAIDYLQLMGTRDVGRRDANTNDQLEYIMRGLVQLAKDFKVPVVLLSQLNRDLERRPDKRPNMADLRASGAIEQDSFNIIFLYRADQYRKATDDKDNKGELIVAKARGGRCGTVDVEFIPKAAKYVDVTMPADEHDEWGAQFDRQLEEREDRRYG